MPKHSDHSDHEHIPSKILNQKLNWILILQFVILALIAALYVFGR